MGVYALKPSVIQGRAFRSLQIQSFSLSVRENSNRTKNNGCEWKNRETVVIMDGTALTMFSNHRRDGPTVKKAYFKKCVRNTVFKTNNSPKTGLDVSM